MADPTGAPITVRPYTLELAEDLFEAAQESIAEVHPWLPWCHPGYVIDESRSWVEHQVASFAKGEEYQFAIFGPTGRFAGGCGLNHLDQVDRRANLGYWVRTSESGRGVAAAAVRLVAAWTFEQTDLERLEIFVAAENDRSLRVAQKVGAVREGILRHRILLHGTFHDAVMHSLVRGDRLR